MRKSHTTLVFVGALGSLSLLAACQTVPLEVQSTAFEQASSASQFDLHRTTPMFQGTPEKDPPPGFVSFCMRFPDQCTSQPGEPSTIRLDQPTAASLERVNHQVNTAIWPEDDQLHYGVAEFWTIPTDGYGDCEDYALTKRKVLSDLGIPKRALRIAEVITPRNNRHAVLTVVTDKGDYVLDSETDAIIPWRETGYHWLEWQDAYNDWGWVALNNAEPRLATAKMVGETTTNK